MSYEHRKRMLLLWVVVCGLIAIWPTVSAATQTADNFNQSWLVLGPYYTKEGIGGNPGGAADWDRDYITDGIIWDQRYIPTTGTVVNTNSGLPQCGSYGFVFQTVANGYPVPTIFPYTSPDETIDCRGGTARRPPLSIFDAGIAFNENTSPQGDNRLDYTITYFWAYANNLTGAPITNARIGSSQDDRLVVYVNGVRQHSVGTGGQGTARQIQNVSGAFTLNPGPNLVMVKLFNGTGGYLFRLRFQTNTNTGVAPAGSIPASQVQWDLVPMGGSYTFPAGAAPPNSATAGRRINTLLNYTPGTPLKVDVTVTTSSGHPGSVMVRELPPQGWTIGTPVVSKGTATVETTTTLRGTTSVIKWDVGPLTPATTNTAVMSYPLTPPVSASEDAVCTGTCTSDAQRTIGRDVYVRAPAGPVGIFDWTGDLGDPFIGQRVTSQSAAALIPVWLGPDSILNGNPRFTGQTTFAGGVYGLTAGGTDLQNDHDRGRILAKRVNGRSFILRGDIKWTSVSTNQWCKAALMLRNATSAGAGDVITGIRNYYNPNLTEPLGAPTGWDGRFRRTQRSMFREYRGTFWGGYTGSAGETAVTTATDPTQIPNTTIVPSRFMLLRRGNVIDGYGLLGASWVRPTGFPFTHPELTSDTILVCLGVSSHVVASSATAEYSNVSVDPLPAVSATRSLSNNGIYTTQPITVSIFLKNGGGSAAITVRDFAPVGWTITGSTPPGVVDDASTITWLLGAFAADTTLTYTLVPPAPDYILPGFFGNGFVNDQTNLISGLAIGGAGLLQRYQVTTFQQGILPDPSYNGTFDAHVVMYRSSARYPTYRGPGLNTGWNNELDEGDNHNDLDHNDNKMGLVRFDVGRVSPAATVFQARLRLFHVRNRSAIGLGGMGGGVPYTTGTFHRVYAAKINRTWNEGSGQGSDGRYGNKDEVTWFWAKAFVSPWASGGLRGGAIDCDMPESFADATTATRGTWLTWDVTRMVDNWVHAPSGNFGLRLSQDDQNTTHYPWGTYPLATYTPGIVNFATRNRATAEAWMRPILTVMAFVPNVLAASHWELYR